MSTSKSPDLSHFANFHLRHDFAEEICFYDVVRALMDRASYEKRQAKRRQLAPHGYHAPYEVYCASITSLPRSPVFSLYYSIAPGSQVATPIMSDAQQLMRVCGDAYPLYRDAILRAEAAMIQQGISPSLLMPVLEGDPVMTWTPPPYFIYFVIRESRAWVLPRDMWSRIKWACPVVPGDFY